jgi:hypothetical protein
MTDLLGNYRLIKSGGKPMNERNGLIKTFREKTGYDVGRLVVKLQGLKVQDLYYLDSVCRQEREKTYKHRFDIEIKKVWNSLST